MTNCAKYGISYARRGDDISIVTGVNKCQLFVHVQFDISSNSSSGTAVKRDQRKRHFLNELCQLSVSGNNVIAFNRSKPALFASSAGRATTARRSVQSGLVSGGGLLRRPNEYGPGTGLWYSGTVSALSAPGSRCQDNYSIRGVV